MRAWLPVAAFRASNCIRSCKKRPKASSAVGRTRYRAPPHGEPPRGPERVASESHGAARPRRAGTFPTTDTQQPFRRLRREGGLRRGLGPRLPRRRRSPRRFVRDRCNEPPLDRGAGQGAVAEHRRPGRRGAISKPAPSARGYGAGASGGGSAVGARTLAAHDSETSTANCRTVGAFGPYGVVSSTGAAAGGPSCTAPTTP